MVQKGFGLIEMLTVLAIAAITLQLAGPVFAEYTQSQRRENAANVLASGLRSARTEALMRNQAVVVHALNDDWGQGWRVILDISGRGHLDPDNPLLLQRQSGVPVKIAGNQPVRRQVRFSSLGEPLFPGGGFQAGTLFICASRAAITHHQVVLSKTGRVSLRHNKAEHALCASGNTSGQGTNAQFLGHRERNVFLTTRQLISARCAPGVQLLDHATHQHFRGRSTSRDADPLDAIEPAALHVLGAIDQVGWGRHALSQLT